MDLALLTRYKQWANQKTFAALSAVEIVLHAVNHGTYHRGNVAAMLYQIGRTPPTTDLPVFLRDAQSA